jgi:hypothetical protein
VVKSLVADGVRVGGAGEAVIARVENEALAIGVLVVTFHDVPGVIGQRNHVEVVVPQREVIGSGRATIAGGVFHDQQLINLVAPDERFLDRVGAVGLLDDLIAGAVVEPLLVRRAIGDDALPYALPLYREKMIKPKTPIAT